MNNLFHDDKLPILIVTLGPRVNMELGKGLVDQGFGVWNCADQLEMGSLIKRNNWPLVLIDLPVPGDKSFIRITEIRSLYCGPIAVVMPLVQENIQLSVFESGADEVIIWPISTSLLSARLMALVRRIIPPVVMGQDNTIPLQIGDLIVDPGRHEVLKNGQKLNLTDQEMDLLQLLAQKVGTVVSRDEISQKLHGRPVKAWERSIDLTICRLRRKLGEDGKSALLIKTVRGKGFLLVAASIESGSS